MITDCLLNFVHNIVVLLLVFKMPTEIQIFQALSEFSWVWNDMSDCNYFAVQVAIVLHHLSQIAVLVGKVLLILVDSEQDFLQGRNLAIEAELFLELRPIINVLRYSLVACQLDELNSAV